MVTLRPPSGLRPVATTRAGDERAALVSLEPSSSSRRRQLVEAVLLLAR